VHIADTFEAIIAACHAKHHEENSYDLPHCHHSVTGMILVISLIVVVVVSQCQAEEITSLALEDQ
jgi:hypothetical protein